MACLDYHGIDHTVAYNFGLSECNRVKGKHYSSTYIHLFSWSSNWNFTLNHVCFKVFKQLLDAPNIFIKG